MRINSIVIFWFLLSGKIKYAECEGGLKRVVMKE